MQVTQDCINVHCTRRKGWRRSCCCGGLTKCSKCVDRIHGFDRAYSVRVHTRTNRSDCPFSVNFSRNSVSMSLPVSKRSKESANNEAYDMDVSKEAKSIIEKILGDVSKTSATKQIVIGTTSGWMTGFLTMKVGKVVAFAVGGGIIILQVAAHQGYVNINWDKIQKKADKITDKVEEKITGEGPKFMDKVERFVDKKLDKAEQLLKNGESRTRRWYHSITGDDTFRPKEIHFFLASFAAGLAIGFATAN